MYGRGMNDLDLIGHRATVEFVMLSIVIFSYSKTSTHVYTFAPYLYDNVMVYSLSWMDGLGLNS